MAPTSIPNSQTNDFALGDEAPFSQPCLIGLLKKQGYIFNKNEVIQCISPNIERQFELFYKIGSTILPRQFNQGHCQLSRSIGKIGTFECLTSSLALVSSTFHLKFVNHSPEEACICFWRSWRAFMRAPAMPALSTGPSGGCSSAET